MRFSSVAICLVSVSIAALSLNCASHKAQSDGKPAQGAVTGYVIPAGTPVPMKGAMLTVKLVDATTLATGSGQEQVVVTQSMKIEEGAPWAFTLRPETIQSGHVYQVRAEVEQKGKKGQMTQKWGNLAAVPVLTGGTPSYVEITVVPR